MPLSEHEQRVFDEIERSLADDPKFASAVRAHDPRHRGRRRMILAGLIALAGIALLVVGLLTEQWVSFVGAVVMFAAMAFALTQRKAGSGELRAVDGKATRRTGRPGRRPAGGGNGLGDRLEERWRRRRDTGWQ
ncbi:Protein of unknown function (DUF3040) [Stackebrandtia albiflava]|uniref:DUF3040 family protein n=1 Tax=Stackebrandtia albiflava TaxID=406432 RepID=A0A562VGN4_9ACTN|nr:DUF3040 domain-containing protein [Stackebrandtia albiflava]TWJ17086.1 Protein of unknown function (DUF3040) [Stackebrandtia albiflava]